MVMPPHIADKAWIGFGASILKGVTIGGDKQLMRRTLATAFAVPRTWAFGRTLLRMLDNRPGRLYSFIAVRP